MPPARTAPRPSTHRHRPRPDHRPVALALTGMCTDLSSLAIRETWPRTSSTPSCSGSSASGEPRGGRGQPGRLGRLDQRPARDRATAERSLGVTYDRVEESHDFVPTPEPIEIRDFPVRAGAVGRVTHRFQGWSMRRRGPFFTMEYNWILGWGMLPEGIAQNEYWVIEVDDALSEDVDRPARDLRRRQELLRDRSRHRPSTTARSRLACRRSRSSARLTPVFSTPSSPRCTGTRTSASSSIEQLRDHRRARLRRRTDARSRRVLVAGADRASIPRSIIP